MSTKENTEEVALGLIIGYLSLAVVVGAGVWGFFMIRRSASN